VGRPPWSSIRDGETGHGGQARIPADLRDCRNLIAEHEPLPTQPARPGRYHRPALIAVGHLARKPPETPEHLKYEQETTAAQARLLSLSSNSKQIFARSSSEYIQFDAPETVINAISEVFDEVVRPVTTTR
jgi:hypothetical protein